MNEELEKKMRNGLVVAANVIEKSTDLIAVSCADVDDSTLRDATEIANRLRALAKEGVK